MCCLLAHRRKKCGELNTNLKLLYCNGVSLMYGLNIDPSHVTHYLKFSVKINTNQLNGHFSQSVPYLEKEISKMDLEKYI